MKTNTLILIFICTVIFLGIFLSGCTKSGIDFKHENPVDKLMHEIKNDKPVLKKSSGVIIYKDNSVTNSTSKSPNFGPRDINFDFKIK